MTSRRRKLGVVLLFLAASFTFMFLYLVRDVLVPFFMAALLAYLLNPLVVRLERRKVPRIAAIAIVYLLLAAGVLLFVWKGLPTLAAEIEKLGRQLPELEKIYREEVVRWQNLRFSPYLPAILREILRDVEKRAEESISAVSGKIVLLLQSFLSFLFSVILAPFFAYYLLRDWESMKEKFYRLLPLEWRGEAEFLGREVGTIINGFLRGHLLVVLWVTVLTSAGLLIAGMDYALLIGLLAGLFELIPYVGPFLTLVPALLLAALEGKKMVVATAAVIIGVQQLENNFLSPRILGNRLHLHPLAVVFFLLAGGKLYGVWGMILAVPVAAVMRNLLTYIFLRFLT